MICGARRSTILLGGIVLFFLVVFLHRNDISSHVPQLSTQQHLSPRDRLNITTTRPEDLKKVQLLLPAASGQESLCKTLLTAAVLGYPIPTLVAYNRTYTQPNLVGGGRHVAKIEAISTYLENIPKSKDSDLVIIVDAYGGFNYQYNPESIESHMVGDVWFQLPLEVLVDRYRALMNRANKDLEISMGKAYRAAAVNQTILFGSSKRCTPNNVQSSACYPVPESPLPPNIYGKYTDAPSLEVGQGDYVTYRQRFLNSGFIVGPVRDLRPLFRRAQRKASDQIRLSQTSDDGSSTINKLHVGSDQAIFSAILGEQEFQREAMRRKYGERPRPKSRIVNVPVEDILDPSFPHEVLQPKGDKSGEFGIVVDYWSDLEMQTADNEEDGRWLLYNQPVQEQLLAVPHQPWSCVPQVSNLLPGELINSTSIPRAAISESSQFSPTHGWDEVPLYTNICLDTIPVVVNHNGDPRQRQRDWPQMWMQPHGRRLIEEIIARGQGGKEERGGAYHGKYQKWVKLCPSTLENELYREESYNNEMV
ncbi:unnamed protein product [Clonostachys rosea]|uniref:Uncharacterized protein n=1 Tax=Bionectria ochroleuca TaxID=29856 RepID=A0ABY6TZW2_BIOOC|nr:unnamed protein product [Clonostachys rosea]